MGGRQIVAVLNAFAGNNGIWSRPNRADFDTLEFAFADEQHLVQATHVFARDHKDALEFFGGDDGAYGLTDVERVSFGLEGKGVIDAGDDEELSGFFIQLALGTENGAWPFLAGSVEDGCE